MTVSRVNLAYLCSRYPAVSHTFINREIEGLEALGASIEPFSMRPGEVLPGGTEFEKRQLAATYCLHALPIWIKLGIPLWQAVRHPLGFTRGLWFALRLQRGRSRESLWALFHLAEACILAWRMERRRVGHVHVHFGGSEASIAMYAWIAFGKTFSFTLHGPDVFYNVDLLNLAAKCRQAAFIVCISHFARSQAMRLLPGDAWSKLHIVHCGVDPERFAPRDRPARAENAPFSVVCVGRLTPTKGQEVLMTACAMLRERGRDLTCTLIGDGDDRARLQRIARERGWSEFVAFTGALGQNEVLARLAAADLFVLHSFAEGVPVVLMEAMAMGIPVVSTRVGGIAELIDHGRTGWLTHAGDLDGLVGAMDEIMTMGVARDEIVARARREMAASFNIHRSAEGLFDIFAAHSGAYAAERGETGENHRQPQPVQPEKGQAPQ